MGSAFLAAYREYLERMIAQSDDLAEVDQFTVPEDANIPLTEEWASIS